jgi:hypothetical protein
MKEGKRLRLQMNSRDNKETLISQMIPALIEAEPPTQPAQEVPPEAEMQDIRPEQQETALPPQEVPEGSHTAPEAPEAPPAAPEAPPEPAFKRPPGGAGGRSLGVRSAPPAEVPAAPAASERKVNPLIGARSARSGKGVAGGIGVTVAKEAPQGAQAQHTPEATPHLSLYGRPNIGRRSPIPNQPVGDAAPEHTAVPPPLPPELARRREERNLQVQEANLQAEQDEYSQFVEEFQKLEAKVVQGDKYNAELIRRLGDKDEEIQNLQRLIRDLKSMANDAREKGEMFEVRLGAITDALTLWASKVCRGCDGWEGEGDLKNVISCKTNGACPARVFYKTLEQMLKGARND